jgi:glucose-6-phosphate dehydrogenase assembly protein OpcA
VEAAVTALPVNEVVGRVEAELTAFWSTPDEQSGEPMPKVRSSTMSYAIVAGAAELDRSREATELLADTHPGRAFLLTTSGRLAPWEVDYEVRAACRLDGGSQPICYDWLEMTFGAVASERAGSVVTALALPEVPVVVEVGRGAPRTLVAALLPRAERLIVDSSHTSAARIAEMAAVAGAPIGDRQFVRTYTWRELIARFFDDALEATGAIGQVTVARTPGGATEPAALLLGWLVARLGWTFEARDRARDRRGERVIVTLRDEARDDIGPGEITGVWIDATLGGEPLSLACARSGDNPRKVSWTRKGARTSSHEHALGFRDEPWVLVKAIDATKGDQVYRDALVIAADWSAR